MSELKPCPFCNAKPMLYDLLDTHGGFSVECPTDGCDTEKMKRTKAEAIAAWNRRAQPAQAVPASCGECGKKTSDGWALYCVACMEKAGLLGGTSSPPLTHPCTSSLVRTADSTAQPVPLLSDAELAKALRPCFEYAVQVEEAMLTTIDEYRAIEQAVRAKLLGKEGA